MSRPSPPSTGSPAVTSKPADGRATVSDQALALIFWQPRQWQAMVSIGGLVTRIRVRRQRQAPSQGSVQLSIAISFARLYAAAYARFGSRGSLPGIYEDHK